jgi:hypothetical protein
LPWHSISPDDGEILALLVLQEAVANAEVELNCKAAELESAREVCARLEKEGLQKLNDLIMFKRSLDNHKQEE